MQFLVVHRQRHHRMPGGDPSAPRGSWGQPDAHGSAPSRRDDAVQDRCAPVPERRWSRDVFIRFVELPGPQPDRSDRPVLLIEGRLLVELQDLALSVSRDVKEALGPSDRLRLRLGLDDGEAAYDFLRLRERALPPGYPFSRPPHPAPPSTTLAPTPTQQPP